MDTFERKAVRIVSHLQLHYFKNKMGCVRSGKAYVSVELRRLHIMHYREKEPDTL
jgi:hypothetical protein